MDTRLLGWKTCADIGGGLTATDILLGFIRLFVFVPVVVVLGLFSLSCIEDKTEPVFCFCRGDGGGMKLVIFRNGILNFEGHRGGFLSTFLFSTTCFAQARVSCFSLVFLSSPNWFSSSLTYCKKSYLLVYKSWDFLCSFSCLFYLQPLCV